MIRPSYLRGTRVTKPSSWGLGCRQLSFGGHKCLSDDKNSVACANYSCLSSPDKKSAPLEQGILSLFPVWHSQCNSAWPIVAAQ